MLATKDLTDTLVSHPIYAAITNERALRLFMRAHVFCVWDFMSLLKSLQRLVTCVEVPWVPAANREAARFISEIVVAEESDVHPHGGHVSHFELYHEAMRKCGADTGPIDGLLARLHAGSDLRAALTASAPTAGVIEFVTTTFETIDSGSPHRIAAAFTFGREDVIPTMFQRLVGNLSASAPERWSTFLYYLERHIEVDGDEHGPLAQSMLKSLCGDDLQRWREAEESARAALQARIALWDAVLEEIRALDAPAVGEARQSR